jgi:thiol-disulfide isomerase/thioredoxin
VRPHAAQPAERTGPKVGEEAPEVRLADLGGKEISLQDFKGKETLVLFWNPGCGFCQQMLPDLKEWEAGAPESILRRHGGPPSASKRGDYVLFVAPFCIKGLQLVTAQLPEKYLRIGPELNRTSS